MNRDEMTYRPDDSTERAASDSAYDALDGRDSASDSPSSLALVDAAARATLSNRALARYQAYKQVLLAREHDEAAIVTTLNLFVGDLCERR